MRHKLLGLVIVALGIGIADLAYAQCLSDADCDPAYFCDITSGLCIEYGTIDIGGDCWSDYDCLPGDICDGGYCVAGPYCTSDADCGEDLCDDVTGECFPAYPDGFIEIGAECATDDECASGLCDNVSGLCAEDSSGCSIATAAPANRSGSGLLALFGVAMLGVALALTRRRR